MHRPSGHCSLSPSVPELTPGAHLTLSPDTTGKLVFQLSGEARGSVLSTVCPQASTAQGPSSVLTPPSFLCGHLAAMSLLSSLPVTSVGVSCLTHELLVTNCTWAHSVVTLHLYPLMWPTQLPDQGHTSPYSPHLATPTKGQQRICERQFAWSFPQGEEG